MKLKGLFLFQNNQHDGSAYQLPGFYLLAEAGGKPSPQTAQLPPKGLPVIYRYIITQELNFKSQNAGVYQQELNLSCLKLS